jgi:adenosine deaminase
VSPDLVTALPRAELHLHIEGTLEPEMMFALAQRNRVALSFASVEEARAAYVFSDLQSFLDIYYAGCSVLQKREDFATLMAAYLDRAAAAGVRHAEVFFDPQTHTDRGIAIADVIGGLTDAIAAQSALSVYLIPCILRHLPVAAAQETLDALLPHREHLVALGLDSSEAGFPPSLFEPVFSRARQAGLRTVAHAGEEGPPAYIWEALDLLHVERIDHGVRCLEDASLVDRLARKRTPLTVCPLSNVRLRVVDTMARHPLRRMLDRGLCASVHSDDPAYFGGYIDANLRTAREALDLSGAEMITLARNSLEATMLPDERRTELLGEIDDLAGARS